MDAVVERLRRAAAHLNREAAQIAAEESLQTAYERFAKSSVETGGPGWSGSLCGLPDPEVVQRPLHTHSTSQQRLQNFRKELDRLLAAEEKGTVAAADQAWGLRRIAELTELLDGEQAALLWWHRAAAAGDPVASTVLAEIS